MEKDAFWKDLVDPGLQRNGRRISTAIILAYIGVLTCIPAMAAPENLDEVVARKARMAGASWGSGVLENAANNYLWQPETLAYTDITTGNEVWKMSSTPSRYNVFHSDIGMSPWSANGNRLAFKSNRDTAAFNRSTYNLWMMTNTDGSRLRPIPSAPARVDYHTLYFHWSPKAPDVYYEMGKAAAGNSGVLPNVLYKATVSDTDVTKSPLVTLPTTKGSDLKLFKTISGDGNKAIVSTNDQSWLFPITLTDGSAALDVANGYSSNRSFGGTWGDTPASYSSYHDAYYPGDGSFLFLMPSGSHAWWKNKMIGSAVDGGSLYSYVAPSTFVEQIPVNTPIGGIRDPFGSHYWSHFVPDRWGRYALFSDGDVTPIGAAVWDISTSQTLVKTFGGGAQHNDWSGFTDWVVTSKGPAGSDYTTDRMYVQKYNDPTSQRTLAYTHTLYNNGGTYKGATYEYDAIPRPAQSPDGTKVSFHSTFLNNKGATYDNIPDIYWTVAYYPFPPEVKSTAKNGGNVWLTWDFNQGTSEKPNYTNPRTYTSRGWPSETIDLPPAPREIKAFRVWRSGDNSNWQPIGLVPYNNKGGVWTETSWSFEAPQAPASTAYYAITSLEYSGLESRTLSNIWKVVLDADGNIAQQTQQRRYPQNPGGKTVFYTIPPATISAQYSYKEAPATADGQYVVKWSAPANASMIRYYNIYARDGLQPFTKDTLPVDRQKSRIASIPASSDYAGTGSFRYVDCLGAPDGSTTYAVTAVDFQGNESLPVGALLMGPVRWIDQRPK